MDPKNPRSPDEYKSVAGYGEAEFIIEKSRFIGYALPVSSEEEARAARQRGDHAKSLFRRSRRPRRFSLGSHRRDHPDHTGRSRALRQRRNGESARQDQRALAGVQRSGQLLRPSSGRITRRVRQVCNHRSFIHSSRIRLDFFLGGANIPVTISLPKFPSFPTPAPRRCAPLYVSQKRAFFLPLFGAVRHRDRQFFSFLLSFFDTAVLQGYSRKRLLS